MSGIDDVRTATAQINERLNRVAAAQQQQLQDLSEAEQILHSVLSESSQNEPRNAAATIAQVRANGAVNMTATQHAVEQLAEYAARL